MEALPAATSSRLPAGVVVQPRKFEFDDLDAVPQDWFAGNPILTHLENAFSIMILPGEVFFIQSVHHYEDQIEDPELKTLVRAFTQQEAWHTRAHDQFNASLSRWGIDVEGEQAQAKRAIDRMRRLPHKVQLGITVFLEHLTATGAHALFGVPLLAESIHPEALKFWRWHAAEELEHKAVAFDVFRSVGGGYLLRAFSAVVALLLLAFPLDRMIRRMIKQDGRVITPEIKAHARALNRKISAPQIRMFLAYFKPGFHPWQFEDSKILKDWYDTVEVS